MRMNDRAFSSGAISTGARAVYFGNTTTPGRAGTSARAIACGGARMKATVPLVVPSKRRLKYASGMMRAIISINSFFSEIGRGYGWSRPSAGLIMATSSDSKRQPRATSAAHSVLLPTPEGPGITTACRLPLEDGGVHQQKTRRGGPHEPVQPEFQHREAQVRGRSLIAYVAVQIRLDLAPQRRQPTRSELDHEVRKLALSRARVGPVELDDLIDQCGFS